MPRQPPHQNARLLIMIAALTGILFVGGIVGAFVLAKSAEHGASRAAAKDAANAVRSQAAKGCDRNQIQRAYLQIRADQDSHDGPHPVTRYAHAYFRILNCDWTYAPDNTEGPVYLEADDERCFLGLVRDGYFAPHSIEPYTDPRRLRTACSER